MLTILIFVIFRGLLSQIVFLTLKWCTFSAFEMIWPLHTCDRILCPWNLSTPTTLGVVVTITVFLTTCPWPLIALLFRPPNNGIPCLNLLKVSRNITPLNAGWKIIFYLVMIDLAPRPRIILCLTSCCLFLKFYCVVLTGTLLEKSRWTFISYPPNS